MESTDTVETLEAHTCWSLMREVPIGRLAVVVDGHPEIFPVNIVVDQGSVVLRTGEGTKAHAAMSDAPVAIEADGFDPETGRAWSVVVKGRAHTITDVEAVIDSADLPLEPWQAGRKDRFVRVRADEVTGRRFPVADASVWRTPASGGTRAAME
ncbi:pyridoxamine 5'-phosphate oxidase family protein [Janibacter sp. G349]|uniref:pyridoxamine 5'-phosphate oxidase family protein n=1 Tax=Janibacter sp. G349 TaxID=3405424 RepID=UPI003B7E79C7